MPLPLIPLALIGGAGYPRELIVQHVHVRSFRAGLRTMRGSRLFVANLPDH
jgi:hypothetical protein